MMVDEENSPSEPPCRREWGSNGILVRILGSTLRGTFERRRLNALKDRSQPINLEMMKDPNILVNAVQ